jgi:hypothetical protein
MYLNYAEIGSFNTSIDEVFSRFVATFTIEEVFTRFGAKTAKKKNEFVN